MPWLGNLSDLRVKHYDETKDVKISFPVQQKEKCSYFTSSQQQNLLYPCWIQNVGLQVRLFLSLITFYICTASSLINLVQGVLYTYKNIYFLKADLQKVLRYVRKLPERQFQFYQVYIIKELMIISMKRLV